MTEFWGYIVTIVVTVAASGGFWAFVQSRMERRSSTTQLLLGIAHDLIITSGMTYLERGWVTKAEYDDLHHYLWKPYQKFGGNGLADKVMKDVENLPIYTTHTGPVIVKGPEKETE